MPIQFNDELDVNEFTQHSRSLMDDLFWEDEELAEFRHKAFLIECGVETESVDESIDSMGSLGDDPIKLEAMLQQMHSSLPEIDIDFQHIEAKQKILEQDQSEEEEEGSVEGDSKLINKSLELLDGDMLVSPVSESSRKSKKGKSSVRFSPIPSAAKKTARFQDFIDRKVAPVPQVINLETSSTTLVEDEQDEELPVLEEVYQESQETRPSTETRVQVPPLFEEENAGLLVATQPEPNSAAVAAASSSSTGSFKTPFPTIEVKRPLSGTTTPSRRATWAGRTLSLRKAELTMPVRRSLIMDKLDQWSPLEIDLGVSNHTTTGCPSREMASKSQKKKVLDSLSKTNHGGGDNEKEKRKKLKKKASKTKLDSSPSPLAIIKDVEAGKKKKKISKKKLPPSPSLPQANDSDEKSSLNDLVVEPSRPPLVRPASMSVINSTPALSKMVSPSSSKSKLNSKKNAKKGIKGKKAKSKSIESTTSASTATTEPSVDGGEDESVVAVDWKKPKTKTLQRTRKN